MTTEFIYGPNRHGGEAVFAPKAGSKSEDDGYLVCFVHDEAQNQSECQIIDAQNIEAGPIATIMMPFRVPYGFPCRVGWRLMGLPLTRLADRASGWGTCTRTQKACSIRVGLSTLARYNAPQVIRPYLARLPDGPCCFFAASKQVNAQNNDNHRVK